MTKREALKLALEALEDVDGIDTETECVTIDVGEAITAIKEALAQPEFIKHEVENADDWSEWVCPNPESYLMKCCDCGLVHEAEFRIARYKSETEREDCDIVDDPNLQAVFRMRRSEQWLPEDTAQRAGGLPMAQPEQEPMALQMDVIVVNLVREGINKHRARELAEHFIKHTTPPQRTDKERILQLIKELRPAIKPLEGMGRGKTTEEWFDILVQDIEEKL